MEGLQFCESTNYLTMTRKAYIKVFLVILNTVELGHNTKYIFARKLISFNKNYTYSYFDNSYLKWFDQMVQYPTF